LDLRKKTIKSIYNHPIKPTSSKGKKQKKKEKKRKVKRE
jgi:hypothetical protein